MNVVYAILAFFLALGPLVIFHEFGHFCVARLFNVKVLRFSIGFGRPLFKIVRGKDRTEWVFAAIPLGGFVAMLDERELDRAPYDVVDLPRAFNRQSVWKRSAIVIAGPLANFLMAIIVYWFVNMYGVVEPRAVLDTPPASTLADRAGIIDGDEVLEVDGAPIQSMVDLRWKLLQASIDRRSVNLLVRDTGGVERHTKIDLATVDATDGATDPLATVGISLQFPPVLGSIATDGAGALAGLRERDRIVDVQGVPIRRAIDLVQQVRHSAGVPLAITVARNDGTHQISVTPRSVPDPQDSSKSVGVIGVGFAPPSSITVRYGPIAAAARALSQTWDMTSFSVRVLGKLVTGKVSLKNISGPVTIADFAGQSARLGLAAFLTFIGFMSISIGLMNLLPVPVLDGGHLLYYFAEIIKGRPPSDRFLQWSQRAGMAVIAGLMSVALFNDFSRLLS